jgi:hypothetical protein
MRRLAIVEQVFADIGDGRIIEPGIEMEQHRMIGKGGPMAVEQRLYQRERGRPQHARPEIVGAHLHAAFVGFENRRGRIVAVESRTGPVSGFECVAITRFLSDIVAHAIHGRSLDATASRVPSGATW